MIKISKMTPSETVKIKNDLKFLSQIIQFCRQHHFRFVVSGGYGLDGILNTITRPHNDLDIIIYAHKNRDKATQEIKDFILQIFPKAEIKTEANPFLVSIDINTHGFGGNIYLVETAHDPFADINSIKLADGKIHVNSETRFPPPVKAKLDNLNFEAENPNLHLADILFKRKKAKLDKHDQDIKNLKEITYPKKVKAILAQY